jgi:hypothetical protein
MDRNRWANRFVEEINAAHCDRNAWALISWIQAEGGTAQWNPLNTTQRMPGSWDYNWVGVQNYPDFETGMAATVKTILQTNPDFGYAPILSRLRRCARAGSTLRAVEKSSWGTGGLALKVLPYVKADYWRFASTLISGSSLSSEMAGPGEVV